MSHHSSKLSPIDKRKLKTPEHQKSVAYSLAHSAERPLFYSASIRSAGSIHDLEAQGQFPSIVAVNGNSSTHNLCSASFPPGMLQLSEQGCTTRSKRVSVGSEPSCPPPLTTNECIEEHKIKSRRRYDGSGTRSSSFTHLEVRIQVPQSTNSNIPGLHDLA